MNPETLDLRHSVRRSVNLALAQIVVARIVVMFFAGIAALFQVIGNFFSAVGNTFFTLELEGARRYETLTGVRLGFALGQPGRYTDLHDGADERFPVTMEQPGMEEIG